MASLGGQDQNPGTTINWDTESMPWCKGELLEKKITHDTVKIVNQTLFKGTVMIGRVLQ